MNFQIKINGTVKNVSQITAEKLSQIITTKYPTEGVGTAVSTLGTGNGDAYVTAFASAGSPEDVIEVNHQDGKEWNFAGKATRGQLVNKMTYALHPETWASELPVKESVTSAPKDKGLPEVI